MLILGSTSPRRKEILSFFKIPFHVISPDFDELTVPFHGNAEEYAKSTSIGKALSLSSKFKGTPILTADTVVSYENQVFLKPENKNDAFNILSFLSGKTHQVKTAVTLCSESRIETLCETTLVTFHPFTETEILHYIDSVPVFDKAGSYAIQGIGSIIVKKLEGCFYNVMGLPLNSTKALLTRFGFSVWDHLKHSS